AEESRAGTARRGPAGAEHAAVGVGRDQGVAPAGHADDLFRSQPQAFAGVHRALRGARHGTSGARYEDRAGGPRAEAPVMAGAGWFPFAGPGPTVSRDGQPRPFRLTPMTLPARAKP